MLDMIKNSLSERFGIGRGTRRIIPLKEHPPAPFATPDLDRLTDSELERLNELIDWKCFTTDSHGRRLGKPATSTKRNKAQKIPDRRIGMLDELVSLKDKTVLEIGCFEGVHTTGLCQYAKNVIAVEGRIESLAKAMIRTQLYGCHPRFLKLDVEERPMPYELLKADVIFHVGVLYHLQDPVSHLLDLKNIGAQAILLDTHFFTPKRGEETYKVENRVFRFTPYKETLFESDPFSGLRNEAKWLPVETIKSLLAEIGFKKVQHLEKRKNRNGNRVLIIASK